jgi:D-glycero-alpha-D-manno-heptose-7-phosphate kinase
MGGLRMIYFEPDGQVRGEYVRLEKNALRRLNENLLLFFTGVTRNSSQVLTEQKQNIGNRKADLRELKRLAIEARNCLEAGEVDELGLMLHESWLLKKGLASQVTNSSIDGIYERARAAGALGGKITGAGGGGFFMLYCPRERQDAVRKALGELQELPFQLEPDGSKVIFNYRR